MTHETETPPPGAKTANYETLTDYYEARLLHQAGELDSIFYVLAGKAKNFSLPENMVPCYTAAFRAQKHFHDSLETLRKLEKVRENKKTDKRTIEGDE